MKGSGGSCLVAHHTASAPRLVLPQPAKVLYGGTQAGSRTASLLGRLSTRSRHPNCTAPTLSPKHCVCRVLCFLYPGSSRLLPPQSGLLLLHRSTHSCIGPPQRPRLDINTMRAQLSAITGTRSKGTSDPASPGQSASEDPQWNG